jgi:hypothetical protein
VLQRRPKHSPTIAYVLPHPSAVKEALGVERPLESLHLLQRRSDQVPIAPDAAVRAALAEVDYPEAVRQVQASVLQRAGAGERA